MTFILTTGELCVRLKTLALVRSFWTAAMRISEPS